MDERSIIVFLQNSWWALLLVLAWTLPWKGYALWVAARRSERKWFIALLIVNTLALLEIFYIFAIARRKPKTHEQQEQGHGTHRQ